MTESGLIQCAGVLPYVVLIEADREEGRIISRSDSGPLFVMLGLEIDVFEKNLPDLKRQSIDFESECFSFREKVDFVDLYKIRFLLIQESPRSVT
jgi:hypothetical protein